MKNNSKLILKLKNIFDKYPWLLLAFLFGSYAKGRAISESDIDLAIWPKKGYKMANFNRLWSDVEKTVGKSVDLVRLDKASPTVAWSAMRGIPLLIKDYKFFIHNLLSISSEAEDIQDFNLGLFKLRQKLRGKIK